MNMEIAIKNLTEKDRSAVVDMMRTFYASPAVFTDGSDEIFSADIDECLSDSPYAEGFGFFDGDKIIGYGMVAKSFSTEFGRRCIWVEDIYITPEYRAQGIAPRFFDFLYKKFEGCIFRLEAEEENGHAVHVYSKQGFAALPYLEMVKK